MSVISQLQNLTSSLRVQTATTAGQPAATFGLSDQGRSDLLDARSRLLRIQRALETLAKIAGLEPRFRLDLPDARSSQGLGLDLTESAAMLDSTGEINAAPMSFSPFGPDWGSGSTALLTIGGEYDGSNGSGGITFRVTRPGIRGINNLQIRVDNPQGGRIGNYNIQRTNPIDQRYDLGNGLFFTLGDGLLIDNDTTTLAVSDSVGAAVDPDKPLGGIRNDYPGFQYYPDPNGMPPIVDGSFEINGEVITVAESDTINSVIERINSSPAGVTAVFNAASERIEFVQNTTGSEPTIDIQNDTSNFLQATKLDAAVVTPGFDREPDKAFADVAEFASIEAGDIVINGTAIAIDPATDSLTAVLDRINTSEAGVTASFDDTSQRVTIAANDTQGVLDLDSNGTRFFGAVFVPEGRVDPEVKSGGISLRRSYEIADAFETLAEELSTLFQDKTFETGGAFASSFRSPLDAAIRASFGDLETVFGVAFDRSAAALRRGDFASIDRREFTTSLQRNGDNVKAFFAGEDGEGGLIGSLYAATNQALQNIGAGLSRSGAFVDRFA